MIEVKSLKFSYRTFQVLRDISFNVHKKEMVFVVGPNGSGKTTLLKCIARILKAKGLILLNDKNIYDYIKEDFAKLVGYVPQRSEISFLTVFDAVLLGRKPYFGWKVTEKDIKLVERILDLMDLKHLSFKKLNELSGGELQKVTIARALVQQPAVLLLDEPTNNLDIKNQIKLMKLLREVVKKEEISAIITTHDLNIASSYADKVIMMKDGKIYASGGVEVLNERNIRAVYGIDVDVVRVNGRVVILPK